MLFRDWTGLIRIVLIGPLAYVSLILFLRVAGKRTLSKMNAFDLVITITLGSAFASVLISRDVPLAEGLLVFAVLILMQFVVAWLSVHSSTICRWVKSDPSLLYYREHFLSSRLLAERVTEGEVLAAVRAQGHRSLSEVAAVVLEPDGSLTVVRAGPGLPSVLAELRGV